MTASYETMWEKESALIRIAASLRAGCARTCRLSPLVLMTDPARMPDVTAKVRELPRGAAVIYRHFGKADRLTEAENLRVLTAAKGQQLLIGNDPELAVTVGADGVHFSRDAGLVGPRRWREKRPDWILTMAGLKDGVYTAPLASLDALFISSVFPSESPSAGAPIGIEAFTGRVARLPLPVYALGGVNVKTARTLIYSGAAGLAGIGGLGMIVRKEDKPYGHRFVIDTDEGEAEMTMSQVKDGVFDADHTFVPKALEGRGIAGKLFDAMAADAKAQGYKVIPGCPYVAMKFKRKPDVAAAIGV